MRIVLLVLRHFVDEEQGQHFNPLAKQLTFPLDVRENGFPYLNAAQLLLADRADHIPGKQLLAVREFHR